MFRLPANLGVGQEYVAVSPDASADIDALEASLPSGSRMLVGLVFSERYEGFLEDCQRAEAALQEQAGLSPWPELGFFITPDPDGQPIAWVHYQSSPAWWTILLVILGGVFLLPIVSVLPVWIIDLMFPGFKEMIGIVVMLLVVGGIVIFLPKLMPKEEKPKEIEGK
ncbi:unnamed protein product [marine sediment metagenome]|uniref:Uncharacterized protein n=1 Tax=marine sediment metagenome TaxID=412755 RepID=X1RMH6_9ZZZZ